MNRILDNPAQHNDFTTPPLKVMQYVVSALMAATVLLILWQHYGMERIIDLSPNSGHPYEIHDDRVIDDGLSVGSMKHENGVMKFGCELIRKIDYPYCGLWFSVGAEPEGIDLSKFDYIRFDLSYKGPGPHAVKVYLRNFERDSTLGSFGTQRVNEVEFNVPKSGVQIVPFALMHTADWWLKKRNLELLDSGVKIDRIISIELSTGTFNYVGKHEIDVRSIRVHGKWISQNRLLLVLLGLWFACGIKWLVLRGIHLRHELGKREARLSMLSAINQSLQLATRELTDQAYSDELTGALNRQGLRDVLVKQWRSHTAPGETAAVIFLDLDHFKHINDGHGHPVGDDVLRVLAAMVQSGIRASDKLVRWGGEEFLIFCPHTTASQAQILAEKLRLCMNRQAWPLGLDVTASFGVTELATGEDIGDGIKRADQALYRAKENGRNRVEVALLPPP